MNRKTAFRNFSALVLIAVIAGTIFIAHNVSAANNPPVTVTITPIPTTIPVLDQTSSFCTNKIPTNLILVNPNATFELLMAQNLKYGQQTIKTLEGGVQVLYSIQTDGRPGERVRCFYEGYKRDGRKIVACVGIVKMSYDIKVCDPTRPNCVTYKLVLPHCPGNAAW